MTKHEKWAQTYLSIAKLIADRHSYAERLKVGCIAVKDNRIISIGINGMPSKCENVCEYTDQDGNLKSKPEVLHAETNCISKLARSTESGEDATLFVTHSPCLECSKLIYQSGISRVYINEFYRSHEGIRFLMDRKIPVVKISDLEGDICPDILYNTWTLPKESKINNPKRP